MNRLIPVLALGLLLLQNGARATVELGTNAKYSHQPTFAALIVAPQQGNGVVLKPDATHECSAEDPCRVEISKGPDHNWFDYVLFGTSLLLGGVGIGGVCVAVKTLGKIERQTAATEKQATHMVVSERPFITVDTRGTLNIEFWMKNWGKSPAKILFLDTSLLSNFHEWSQERQEYLLPGRPSYGPNYWDDQWEQINVQWLGPGEDRCFASIPMGDLEVLDKMKRVQQTEPHAQFIYSAIKYRGMSTKDIYHSRFCYRFGPEGLYMAGPHGYNQYT